MAPVRAKKRQSSPAAAQTPPKAVARITHAQKQALIDNLQLEVTERARKMRAQYALQASALRSRIEGRVNRIPKGLRKANMGELLEKYVESTKPQIKAPPKPQTKAAVKKPVTKPQQPQAAANPAPKRGLKRTSDAISGDDKENTPDPSHGPPMPKKRATAAPPQARATAHTSTVLSPKSSNSRTFPQSSIRPPFGTQKSTNFDRPNSPLKPASPPKAATAKATSMLAAMVEKHSKAANAKTTTATARAAAKPAPEPKASAARPKRGTAQTNNRVASNSSTTSGTSVVSTGTTIVKRVGRALNVSNTTVKKAAAPKKTAPAKTKAETTTTSSTGRRVLRKRA